MTDATVILIVGQLTTLIGAGIAAWVSVRNGQRSAKRGDEAAVKQEQIHVLVNSKNAEQTTKIASLEEKIERLLTSAGVSERAAATASLVAVEKAAAVAAAVARATGPTSVPVVVANPNPVPVIDASEDRPE